MLSSPAWAHLDQLCHAPAGTAVPLGLPAPDGCVGKRVLMDLWSSCSSSLQHAVITAPTFTAASPLLRVHSWNEPEEILGSCIHPQGVNQSGQGGGGSSLEMRSIMEELKMCHGQHWGYPEPPGGCQTRFKSCINTARPGPEGICLRGRLMLGRMVPWADIYSSLRSNSDKMKLSPIPYRVMCVFLELAHFCSILGVNK